MTFATLLERIFKWLLIGSAAVFCATYFFKDAIPDPSYYDATYLGSPVQRATGQSAFTTRVNGEEYRIEPEFDYELFGVVVSYHDADAFSDIWHHDRWKDFINLRDLCVIWGDNVISGVYQDMDFNNDSWTCWAYWPDAATGSRFAMQHLSNNHILADNTELQRKLMRARPGDHIRLKGVLASYSNPNNGFHRGTSTVRTDTGNGACETIYLQDFEILNEANPGARRMHRLSKWIGLISLLGFLAMFAITPARLR